MATPTYDLLASSVLTSSASSVTFSSISQDYRDLVLVTEHKSVDGSFSQTHVRINGDSSSEYRHVWMQGNGSTATSSTLLPTYILGVSTTTVAGWQSLQFMDYSATDKHKTILQRRDRPDASVRAQAIRWPSTSAITSLEIFTDGSNYAIGSTFYLYGILA